MKNAFLRLTLILACGTLLHAQVPIVNPVNQVSGAAPVRNINAEIIPILWKAEIGTSIAVVPLPEVEHYGIQDYKVDGQALVKELTITTRSRSMIRIYHLLPLGGIHKTAAERIENITGNLENAIDGSRDQDDDIPIKSYPVTTHEKMVEYRVSSPEDIGTLYESIDKAMTNFLGKDLVSGQRPQIVEKVAVSKE